MKRRVWKWVLGVVAAMAVVLGIVAGDAHRRATAVFASHEKDVAAGIARLRARGGAHADVHGEVIPGNGWEALGRALEAFRAIPKADADLIPEFADTVESELPPASELEAIFVRHAALVEELRRALRHTELRAGYRYEEGLSLKHLEAAPAMGAARFLAGLAVHRRRMGRDGQALEPVLLGLGMAQELGRDGPLLTAMVQRICERIAIEAWREVLNGHGLAAVDLERMAKALGALEATRPGMGPSLEVEDLLSRRTLVFLGMSGLDSAAFELEGFWAGRSWRTLFSRRLAYAGALPRTEKHYREVLATGPLTRLQRLAERERLLEGLMDEPNPMARRWLPSSVAAWWREEISIMSWTLMRVATAIAWYEAENGVMPAALGDLVPRFLLRIPDCPMSGKPLGYAPGKVWSFGVDGVDDGGVPHPQDDEKTGGDVVWVVKRK